jgi:hypothetical protein
MIANLGFDFGVSGKSQRTQPGCFRYSAIVDLIASKPTATSNFTREQRK